MDAVDLLIARAAGRLRRRRAVTWGGRVGVVAFGLLLLDGVIARIIPLTDGTWPRFMLLAAPVAAVVAAILLRVDARAARTEAGRWIGQPALLLAAESDRTSLSPLVASRAREGAPTATPPARTVDGWARSAALLLVPAIVAAFAPGRVDHAPLLGADDVRRVRTLSRALMAEGVPESVSRDRRDAVRKAMRSLDRSDVKAADVQVAVEELKAAIRDAGGTWSALTEAAAEAPLLAPTWQALDRGDAEAALAALRDLASKIEDGSVAPRDLRAASSALIAAVGGASEGDRALLDEAGRAIGAGDGSGLTAALSELLPRIGPPDAATRGLERSVVALQGAVGQPGAAGGTAPAPTGPTLAPRGTTAEAAIDAFDDGYLAPRQREILRNYFAHR